MLNYTVKPLYDRRSAIIPGLVVYGLRDLGINPVMHHWVLPTIISIPLT